MILRILWSHRWAVIFALLAGLTIVLPYIYFRLAHGDIYQGIEFLGSDEPAYLTRVQEMRDGHFGAASYVWAEGKDLPYLTTPLSEIIISSFGLIFGLDAVDTVTLARFVFPALLLILIYGFVYRITKKKHVSLAAALTVLLSTNLAEPRGILDLFSSEAAYTNFLPFNRIVSPLNLIFFFGFLLLFWLFLAKEKKIYGSSAGLVLGLSFYTYPYNWTFLFAFLVVLAMIFLWDKNWEGMKKIGLVMAIALVVAIPLFVNLWQAMSHPNYAMVSQYYGMIRSRVPQYGVLVLFLLGIFLLLFPRARSQKYYFSLALVLTPLVVLNQQIITGRAMIPDHYHWYYHRPLAVIFFIIIAFCLLDKIKKDAWRKTSAVALFGLILGVNFYYGWTVQSSAYRFRVPETIENQRYGAALKWLQARGKKDQVVMGDELVSSLIPMYTWFNAVSAADGHYALVADERGIMERTFLLYRLDDLAAGSAREFFYENRRDVSAALYGQYYRKQLGDYGKIPDEKLNFLIEEYRKFLSLPLRDILIKYQVRYLIWDTTTHPNWRADQYPFLEEIYRDQGIKIFRVV